MLILLLALLQIVQVTNVDHQCQFIDKTLSKVDYEGFSFPDGFTMDDILSVKVTISELATLPADTPPRICFLHNSNNPGSSDIYPIYFQKNDNGLRLVAYKTKFKGQSFLGRFEVGSSVLIQFRCTSEKCILSTNDDISKVYTVRSTESATVMDVNELWIPKDENKAVRYEYVSVCKPKEPTLNTESLPEKYVIGQPYTLICRITGPPMLKGLWSKEGVPLDVEEMIDESQALHILTMTYAISSFQLSDVGVYVCKGKSSMVGKEFFSSSISTTESANNEGSDDGEEPNRDGEDEVSTDETSTGGDGSQDRKEDGTKQENNEIPDKDNASSDSSDAPLTEETSSTNKITVDVTIVGIGGGAAGLVIILFVTTIALLLRKKAGGPKEIKSRKEKKTSEDLQPEVENTVEMELSNSDKNATLRRSQYINPIYLMPSDY